MEKKPLKKEVLSALGLLFLLFIGLSFWLAHHAEQTLEEREASLPVAEAIITLARPEIQPPPTEPLPSDTELVPPHQDEPQKDEDADEATTQTDTKAELEQPVIPSIDENIRDVSVSPALPEATPALAETESVLEAKSLIPADMVIAPLRDLVEPSPIGNLPIVSAKGDKPWHMYGRFIDKSDNKAHIALVMNDVGLSKDMLNRIFEKLPNTVNLAFNPYAENIAQIMEQARDKKFEPLMLIPMQPANFPTHDAGPQSLLSDVSQTQNIERLYWALSRGTGYVGVMNYMGSDFLKSKEAMEPVFKDLSNRGLLLVDTLAGTGHSLAENIASSYDVPYIAADLIVDEYPVRLEIEKQLRALEILAHEFGYAVGVVNPLPLSIDTVANWSKKLAENPEGKNIVLVPLSNIVEKKMSPRNAE